jgi:uncharacterized protein (TIGR03435 family)
MMMDRTIVDLTGLTGRYDFELKWTPDAGLADGVFGPPPEADGHPADPDGPTIFTAIEEQAWPQTRIAKRTG